jgi:uncharacterized membrane protein
MHKGRLEAFSDGVLAIIITIMVLELKVPDGTSLEDLRPLIPDFVSYALSFVFVGIYWTNHHHLMQAVKTVNGPTLWANLHLLFWLSLIPFVTRWIGVDSFASWPVAFYGIDLLFSAIAYYILVRALLAHPGENSTLATALGSDFKGKISIVIYLVALLLCFLNYWLAYALYGAVALMWLVPDKRIEKVFSK